MTGSLAQYYFAPTSVSKGNLLKEGVVESNIIVTGNTVIDAFLEIKHKIKNETDLQNTLAEQLPILEISKS